MGVGRELKLILHEHRPQTLPDQSQEQTEPIEMAESPAVKDLPKIDDTLKGQLLGSHNLKHQEAAEKNVLPSAQDIKEEKIHENVLTGITGFDQTKLKDVETKEKVVLPDSEQIQTEKTHQNLLHGVEGGVQLKHVKTREPSTPTSTMQVEIARDSSLAAVNEFDKSQLKMTETAEKNPLPPQEAIIQEKEHTKFKEGIELFDKRRLSHTETVEKNPLPTKEVIETEKTQ